MQNYGRKKIRTPLGCSFAKANSLLCLLAFFIFIYFYFYGGQFQRAVSSSGSPPLVNKYVWGGHLSRVR